MKKSTAFIGAFLVCLVIAAVLAKIYFFSAGEPVTVHIKPGQSGAGVAKLLKKEGVIRSELLFKLVLRLTSSVRGLRSGAFDLHENMPALQVIKCITTGSCIHYEKLTVLEGWRSEEIAGELSARDITNAQEFLDIVRARNLEGKMFPSTYLFTTQMPASAVVEEMLAQYHKSIDPLFKEYPTDLTESQVLTLASIVEREAVWHEERPKIAAVYINRFRMGKKLEADPTVQYALGFSLKENRFWKKRLTYKDLKTDSPYNTYRNEGLPPAPICNPGYESIRGVLNPTKDFTAIYFVADRGGKHVFSNTYKEHLAHIKRIRGK